MLLRQKTVYLKVLQQKMVEITTKSSHASLTATVDSAADLPARNLPQREDIPCDAAVKLAGLLLVVIFEQLLQ